MKRFVIHGEEQLRNCHSFIEAAYRESINPVEVVIGEYDPKRTSDQNSRRWARMTWLQDFATDETGRKLTKESWHYKLLIECGYVSGSIPFRLNGIHIEVPAPESSAKMGRRKFSEMEEKTDALLASEYGIVIPELDCAA